MSATGWLCPKCGSGVAPGVERCPCVKGFMRHDMDDWIARERLRAAGGNPPPSWDDTHKDDAKVPDFKG